MPFRVLKPPPHWLDLAQVEHEADRLMDGSNLRLLFPPAIESLFNEERLPRRQGQLARMVLFALFAYDMFLVGDFLSTPRSFTHALVVRLGVITPITLLVLWLMRRYRWSAPVQEFATSTLCVVACAGMLYLYRNSSDASIQVVPSLLLLLLAMNTLLRPEFWMAIVGTGLCCAMLAAALLTDEQPATTAQLWNIGGQVFWFAVLSLLANYALNREQRFSWLLQMRGRIQRQMLAEANRELLTLSMQDQLTGIPNRGAYNKRLPELWQHSIEQKCSFAAVMVDVDYFKEVNDNFGHLYGDRVLQRIASLLEQSLRAELDFVARYGGEEFVVLLPGSTLEAGVHVAERIRKLVEVAGSPAVSRGDAPLPPDVKWSTVSCGVAATMPTEHDDPRSLIDAADAALYLAKESGRNRVCTTGSLSLVHSA